MEKLLIICGPTATGKTSLALHLAKVMASGPVGPGPDHRFKELSGSAKGTGPVGELVSADSRQVYKGMDIGTGKDLPINVKLQITNVKCNGKKICYYKVNGVKVWGYDLVEPTENFSVGQYLKIAKLIINDIWNREKLPILVGGTGLYIKGVIDGISTASIPKNIKLRKILEGKKPDELFKILAQFDPTKAASMNISDRKNPRRLVRAIEIAEEARVRGRARGKKAGRLTYKPLDSQGAVDWTPKEWSINTLFIGLRAEKRLLDEKIENRVNQRVNQGIEDEIKKLFTKGVTWKHQAMSSLGYRQLKGYLLQKIAKKEAIKRWKVAEKQYVRRQMTWFTREKRITWFDITKSGWEKSVEKLVKKWYSSNNNGKANKN